MSTKKLCFNRMAEARGKKQKVNISEIAKKTQVPVANLWKRVHDKVWGMGHQSGGPQQPKVLSKHKLIFCLN